MYDGIDMTKVMFGQNAIHVPMWMVIQDAQEAGVLFAGASLERKLLYGSDRTHVLVLGEMIVRPHFVVASNDFRGRGAGGFWTDLPSAQEWLRNGQVIVDTDVGEAAFKRWR